MIAALLKRMAERYERWSHGGLTCAEAEAFLIDYVEGTLAAAPKRAFEKHLRKCPLCVAFLADYKAAMRTAQAAGRMEPMAHAPSELLDAIAAAIAVRDEGIHSS